MMFHCSVNCERLLLFNLSLVSCQLLRTFSNYFSRKRFFIFILCFKITIFYFLQNDWNIHYCLIVTHRYTNQYYSHTYTTYLLYNYNIFSITLRLCAFQEPPNRKDLPENFIRKLHSNKLNLFISNLVYI